MDSGTIGLLPVVACHARLVADTTRRQLGREVTFLDAFTATCEGGVFTRGHLTMDTRGDNAEEEG